MNEFQIPANVRELESLLPVIEEKERQGLILPSLAKARSLVMWGKTRPLSEKQNLFIGKLIFRARRKHKSVSVTADVTAKVDTAAITEKILAEVREEYKLGTVDVDKVVDAVIPRVMSEMEKRAPRKVEVVVKRQDEKEYRVEGHKHAMFDTLLRAAVSRLPTGYSPGIFLQGEASSGKTTGAKMLADALKLNWHFNGAISFPHEMLGFIDGAGKYHRTPFRDAYEKGGVYTFDEVDRSDPVALLAVNPHLANGVATFPDKQVRRHKDCIIVCTANTWGLGADANYSGATKLDAAFLSRFPIRINWDIDPQLEETIVAHPEWLARVRRARERARACGIKVMIDTRIALAGASMIGQGFSIDEAANFTYLANLKPEQRKQVEYAGA
jgi:dynein-related subfamily AAA family protein